MTPKYWALWHTGSQWGKAFKKFPRTMIFLMMNYKHSVSGKTYPVSLLKSSLLQTLSIWDKHISTKKLNSCSNDFLTWKCILIETSIHDPWTKNSTQKWCLLCYRNMQEKYNKFIITGTRQWFVTLQYMYK